jgi:hypothetical protein
VIFVGLNLLFLTSFVLSAIVQYNDPDALIWIAIYVAAAGMCLAQHLNHQPRWLPPLLLVICLIWIAWLLPSIIGQVSLAEVVESISMQTRAVEEAREIGGLAIVAFWAICITIRQYQTRLPGRH